MTAGTPPPELPALQIIDVRIESTQRLIQIAVPPDLTALELLEFVSWLSNPEGLREMIQPKSPIVTLGQLKLRPV